MDQVAVVTMDDGKASAFRADMIEAVNNRLGRSEEEAKAVVLTDLDGIYSGPIEIW